MKGFKEWLQQKCSWWYLLSPEQEEQYFSQWFDECFSKRKENDSDDEMV